jgi:O-antigen/teichoic acid export membrane protein
VLALVLFVMIGSGGDLSLLTVLSVLASGALLAYASLQAQIVILEEKHLSSLCFGFVLPATGLLGSFLAFLFERTVQSFFWGATGGLLVSLIAASVGHVGFHRFPERIALARPIVVRVMPIVAVTFLGWLSGYGNNFVIKFFFDSTEIARFTFAMSISSAIQLVASALNQVWSPRFYRTTHELPLAEVERKNRRFFRLQGVALGLFGGGVIAVYEPLMKLLGGNLAHYQSMGVELLLLFSSYVVLSPWWHCHNYLLAYDRGPLVMRIVLVTSVVGVALWLMLMWLLGPLGIYIGFLTQMLTRSLGIVIAARKYWPVRPSWDGVLYGVLITSLGFAASRN